MTMSPVSVRHNPVGATALPKQRKCVRVDTTVSETSVRLVAQHFPRRHRRDSRRENPSAATGIATGPSMYAQYLMKEGMAGAVTMRRYVVVVVVVVAAVAPVVVIDCGGVTESHSLAHSFRSTAEEKQWRLPLARGSSAEAERVKIGLSGVRGPHCRSVACLEVLWGRLPRYGRYTNRPSMESKGAEGSKTVEGRWRTMRA